MRLDIHVHDAQGKSVDHKLDEVISVLADIKEAVEAMSAELDALRAKVEETTKVEESAIALIQGLSQQIKDAGTDPAALQALTEQLDAEQNKLAAAVAANTGS